MNKTMIHSQSKQTEVPNEPHRQFSKSVTNHNESELPLKKVMNKKQRNLDSRIYQDPHC